MDEYNAPGRKELAAMVSQIGVLERQLDDAAKQIAAMRQELPRCGRGPSSGLCWRRCMGWKRAFLRLGRGWTS